MRHKVLLILGLYTSPLFFPLTIPDDAFLEDRFCVVEENCGSFHVSVLRQEQSNLP